MTNPPKPPPTDPDQHAPGISQTLEEHAALRRAARERASQSDGESPGSGPTKRDARAGPGQDDEKGVDPEPTKRTR